MLELRRYNSIGPEEVHAAATVVSQGVLSGYLAGVNFGGPQCEALEGEFAAEFFTAHAVAVNSATSGLLAACNACWIGPGDEVIVSPYTMSATAAAPLHLGAKVKWGAIDSKTFNLIPDASLIGPRTAAVIVTNLFGHPARLNEWRGICDRAGIWMIEDNAQAIRAMEHGCYAGTVGHIGVFSLNVHKHIQCGEGGVCLTDEGHLAQRMRNFRNHGEAMDDVPGLNLRMTEVSAAIAREQLKKSPVLVGGRRRQAERLSEIAWQAGLPASYVREGYDHSWYIWSVLLESTQRRDAFVDALCAKGFPMQKGYMKPLYAIRAFPRAPASVMRGVEDIESRLATFENCAWDVPESQWEEVQCAFDAGARALQEVESKRQEACHDK